VLLTAAAATLVWFTGSVIGPYAIEHRPGPENPDLSWYLQYRIAPFLFMIALAIIVLSAWLLWRRGKIDYGFGRSLEHSPLMHRLGMNNGAQRYALLVGIVATASTAAIMVAFLALIAVLGIARGDPRLTNLRWAGVLTMFN
jgi:hypothetical protein